MGEPAPPLRRGDREPGEARLAAVEPERRLTAADAVAGGSSRRRYNSVPRIVPPHRGGRGCGTDRQQTTKHGARLPSRQEVVWITHSGVAIWLRRGPALEC